MDTNREIEKDEKIAQLERLLIELKEAQQQSAATIAVDYNLRSLSAPNGKFKFASKVAGLKVILAILVLLVLALGGIGIWLSTSSNSKQDSVTFVEDVQELSTLATAEAYTKGVLHVKDNKIFGKRIPFDLDLPGTKREVLLIVPATVIAGVDLKGISSEDMDINEETKEIDITLPHAKLIQDPSLQMDKIQSVDDSGLFRGDIKWDEGNDLTAKVQEQIRQDAITSGLLDAAEKNAEKVLKEFFKKDGYTVNVTIN
jgi:hypothetical protein